MTSSNQHGQSVRSELQGVSYLRADAFLHEENLDNGSGQKQNFETSAQDAPLRHNYI